MPIEETLGRIATATESIAKSLELLVNSAAGVSPINKEAVKTERTQSAETNGSNTPKTEAPKTRPGKKVEVKSETVGEELTDSFYTEEANEPDPKADIEQPKWAEVNKKLFGMLNEVARLRGRDEAKDVCATLMKKYTGGQKFADGVVKPGLHTALLEDIEAELDALAEFEAANG